MRAGLMIVLVPWLASLGAVAQDGGWDARERDSLRGFVYQEIEALSDFESIRDVLERALADDATVAPDLLGLLGHENNLVAMSAARALGRFPDENIAARLRETFLSEERALVRAGAVAGLGRMRAPMAAATAIEGLSDPSVFVHDASIGALEDLADSAHSPALVAFYQRNPEKLVLEVLGQLGDPPESTVATDLLVSEAFKTDRPWDVRVTAALAAQAAGVQERVQPLFDWRAARDTFQSIALLRRLIPRKAAAQGVSLTSQAELDGFWHALLDSDHDLARRYRNDGWERPLVPVLAEGLVRLESVGPDGQLHTDDDITGAETFEAYVFRILPELF